MDYKDFDEKFKYHYRDERKEIAEELGYTYISECVASLYSKLGSVKEVAKEVGVTPGAVSNELRKMKRLGVKVKIKPRGGPNFKGKGAKQRALREEQMKAASERGVTRSSVI